MAVDDHRRQAHALSVLDMIDAHEIKQGGQAVAMRVPMFDSSSFRRALGLFATGVTIITARGADGQLIGMTCNSFASLSLEPPLVQWAIAKSSRNYSPMCGVDHFAVHVLAASQRELCRQFSAREGDRFANVELEYGLQDLPLLKQYHARFECATHDRFEAGDHTIIVGHVLRLCELEGEPLIFYRGALSAVASGA